MAIFFTKSQNIIKPNIICQHFIKKTQILFWQLLQKDSINLATFTKSPILFWKLL